MEIEMTMTLLFDDATDTVRGAANSPLRRTVVAVVGAFVAWRAARARRIALASLMEMDAYRLDDLGITAKDVVDALNRR
jgi:uncharacterized protein YjiS (DUF1127 family)